MGNGCLIMELFEEDEEDGVWREATTEFID
jgi:hypothetical protein